MENSEFKIQKYYIFILIFTTSIICYWALQEIEIFFGHILSLIIIQFSTSYLPEVLLEHIFDLMIITILILFIIKLYRLDTATEKPYDFKFHLNKKKLYKLGVFVLVLKIMNTAIYYYVYSTDSLYKRMSSYIQNNLDLVERVISYSESANAILNIIKYGLIFLLFFIAVHKFSKKKSLMLKDVSNGL